MDAHRSPWFWRNVLLTAPIAFLSLKFAQAITSTDDAEFLVFTATLVVALTTTTLLTARASRRRG